MKADFTTSISKIAITIKTFILLLEYTTFKNLYTRQIHTVFSGSNKQR